MWPQVADVPNIKYLSSFDEKFRKITAFEHIYNHGPETTASVVRIKETIMYKRMLIPLDCTDTPYALYVCLALPISSQAKLRSICCPDLREDLNNSTFGPD